MMEISQVSQMIIEFAPVITALVGIMVSLIVGIKKIKNNNNKTYTEIKLNNEAVVNELRAANDKLIEDNARLKEENEEFKKALREFLRVEEEKKIEPKVKIVRKRKK